jgi:hypothetical protein
VNALFEQFGKGTDLTKSVIGNILEAENGDYDSTVDILLNMTNDVTGIKPKQHQAPVQPKQPQANPFDEQRRDINTIKGMFRGQADLTESVISTVYQQNKGDVERTAETLLDIGSDTDAVNQIRQHANQKKPVVVEHPRQPNQPVGPKPVPIQEPPKWPAVPPKQPVVPTKPSIDPEEEEKRLRLQKIEELRLKKEQQALLVEKEKQLAQLLAKQEAEERARLELLRKQKEEAERLEREQQEREEMERKLEEMQLENERLQGEKQKEEERKKQEAARKAQEEAERQEKEKANRLALEERIRLEQEEHRKMQEAERNKLAKDLDLQVVEQGSSAGDDEEEGEDLENSRLNKEEQDKLCTIKVDHTSKTVLAVSWNVNDKNIQPTNSDWIGLYRFNARNKKYKSYIKTGGKKQGNDQVPVPSSPGLFEFRYFTQSNMMIAKSTIFLLGTEVHLISTQNGNKLKVNWMVKAGELTKNDWIGFYAQDSPNRQYLHSAYVPKDKTSFEIDAPRKPGQYEFRYFPYGAGYNSTARSNVILILNKNKLDLDVAKNEQQVATSLAVKYDLQSEVPSASDWIGVYRAGHNDYLEYKYVDMKEGQLQFNAPWRPGKYELKYYSKSAGSVVMTKAFEIEDKDQLSVSIEGTALKVTWDLLSVKSTASDWIGIYKAGEENNKQYVTFKYIDPKQNWMLLNVPEQSGSYQVRYFTHQLEKYDDLKRTAVFDV